MELASLLATTATFYLAAFYTVPFAVSDGFLSGVAILIVAVNGATMAWLACTILQAALAGLLVRLRITASHNDRVRACACFSAWCAAGP